MNLNLGRDRERGNGVSVLSQKDAIPGAQWVPKEEHQAAPLVLVLESASSRSFDLLM